MVGKRQAVISDGVLFVCAADGVVKEGVSHVHVGSMAVTLPLRAFGGVETPLGAETTLD